MEQALKTVNKELLVDDHNDHCQIQLYQTHHHMVAVHKCRQRPVPHHMSHGEIHKDK